MIYFIQDSGSLSIKVGYTGADDAEQRLRSLQTGCPSELVLLGTMPGDMDTERMLHQRFAKAHDRGEWFRPIPELIGLLRSEAIRHMVPSTPRIEKPSNELRRQLGWDHELTLMCPVCGFFYTHSRRVYTRPGTDEYKGPREGTIEDDSRGYAGRRGAIVVVFACENECRFEMVITQHKGTEFIHFEQIEEDAPEDDGDDITLEEVADDGGRT